MKKKLETIVSYTINVNHQKFKAQRTKKVNFEERIH